MVPLLSQISSADMFLVLPFIFLAGLLDSIAGGGGLISLPAYWSMGISPHMALGTNKFSSSWGTLFSTGRYLKAGMIDIPVAVCSALAALIGSWLGAKVALLASSVFLNYLLIFLIPAITVLTLIKKDIGQEDKSANLKQGLKFILAVLAGLSIGFYDGFFGPGTGTLLIIIFSALLKYDFIRANANAKVVNLASNIAAVVTFGLAGKIFYPIAIPGAIFGIAGNLLGSSLVIKKGNRFIRIVFITAMLLLLIKIISQVVL